MDSTRNVNLAAAAGTRQLNQVQPWLPQQANPPVASTATQPRVSSRPIQAVRWDETRTTDDQGNSASTTPVVSWGVATVPITYPLTKAGVATVLPPSPLTTASGSLMESTVHDSTRPRPNDRQDGAQFP